MRLSARESEVLKWTAEGKTAFDIGMILSLTTRTVNFHISSAIRKMGANNKTSAVVIATKSGLL
ncbi:LuxR C-terminal-related transcriptional regulator [Pseudomonas sp. WS 5071]|uniref:LuxR C-terminal-related transcriptional regulator n=1 Tax=Pseudomonas sp. WS 5071 TaxID=2717479 RepID=UPI0021D0F480|nr:LuxR C-terminal-related transcriptional regulator [Pseudomonas sp. WS 5071]